MATEPAIQETPQSMIVGPYRYAIDFDQTAAYDHNYLGVCLYRTKRVLLDPLQSDTELAQTFMHEALHALGHAYEIPEWLGHRKDENDHVTDKIDMMASAFLQFLRDNPDLVKWLVRPV